MLESDESVAEEALFGSGPDGEEEDLHHPIFCSQAFILADEDVRMREIQATGDLVDGPSDSGPPTPVASAVAVSGPDHRRRVVDVRRSDPVTLTRPDLSSQGLSGEGTGARPRDVRVTGRDQGARKKSLKNKENIDKNHARVSNPSESSLSSPPENRGVVNRLLARSSNTNTFEPKLQLKKYDNDMPMPKKVLNSDKDKKQSQNLALNGASNLDVRYVNDTPVGEERFVYDQEHTCGPQCHHVNDSPESAGGDEDVILPSSRQRVNGRSQTRRGPVVQHADQETEDDFNSVQQRNVLDSDDDDNGQTLLKIVQTDGLERLQNNLWGSDSRNAEKINATRIPLDKSSLNQVMVHDVEADGYPAPSNQNLYVKLETQSDGNSPIENPQTSPIVVSYDHNQRGSRTLNGIRAENASPFGIPASDSNVASDSVMTLNGLPSSCLFGDGESDSMLAHRLQQRFDREAEEGNYGYDIGPSQLYYSRGEHSMNDDSVSGRLVLNESGDFLHNDLYNPGNSELGTSHSPVRVRYGMLNEEPASNQSSLSISAPVQVLPYSQQESHSDTSQNSLQGHALYEGEEDDEILARRLQEELDEQMARQLQETEGHTPAGVDETPIFGRRRRYSSDEGSDAYSVHPGYRNTWQNRPLTIDPPARGRSVSDSRGYNTWQRPLQHRHQGYQFQGHNTYDRLGYLDNIHSVEEGYDIPPPGAVDYYLRYDADPENAYGDDRLISINRDPQLLVSILMDRDPDMRIPDNIDLNDYEALWELAENLGEVRRVGMETSEISVLPVHTYKASAGATEGRGNTTDCLVCLSEFSDGEQLRTLPCCHIYHVNCIDEWLKRNAICPVCRQPAVQRD